MYIRRLRPGSRSVRVRMARHWHSPRRRSCRFDYWSTEQQVADKFIAAPGSPVQVRVRRTAEAGAAREAFVMVFPHWSSLEMWHWGDSLSIGEGLSALFALLLFVPGVAVVFVAVVLALL